MFIAAQFIIAKTWKQPKCSSTDEWIRKNEIMPFAATWMDLENIILNEVSQTEKDKCYVMSLICGI